MTFREFRRVVFPGRMHDLRAARQPMPARRPFAWLFACLAAGGCADTDPTSVGRDGPEPVMTEYYHYTGAPGCDTAPLSEPRCLFDDVETPWVLTGNPGASYNTSAINAVTPMGRGETLTADYISTHVISGESTTGPVACWTITGANRSREVRIYGKGSACSSYWFYYTATVALPNPQVIAFERPDTLNCAPYTSCPGPFRVKVDIPGSGWFHSDETRVYVENAGGSRWGVSASSFTVSGTTLEFVFNSLFYPGEGSRIVVLYQPWGKSVWEDTTEIYLPIAAPSPDLLLTAQPGAIDSAGKTVSFVAAAAGATSLSIVSWNWVPNDTAIAGGTVPCAGSTNPCNVPVHESGMMHVTAMVDGQTRLASAPVLVYCPLLAQPSGDPTLDDPYVQHLLLELWRRSNYPDPNLANRSEYGGWVIERPDGSIELVDYSNPSPGRDLCWTTYYPDE